MKIWALLVQLPYYLWCIKQQMATAALLGSSQCAHLMAAVQEYYLRLVGHYREFIEPDTSELDEAAAKAGALPAAHAPASNEDDGYVRCASHCVIGLLQFVVGFYKQKGITAQQTSTPQAGG